MDPFAIAAHGVDVGTGCEGVCLIARDPLIHASHRLEHCREQRDLDVIPQAGALTRNERRDNAVDRDHSAVGRSQWQCRKARTAREAGRHLHRARLVVPRRRPDDALPRSDAAACVVGSKAGQRAPDGVLGTFESKSEPGWRSKAIDHDVGTINQLLGHSVVRIGPQIERDSAFSPLQDGVRVAVPQRAIRWIDPRHLRAMVGQDHRREWAGDVLPEIDDANALQDSRRRGLPRQVGRHGLMRLSRSLMMKFMPRRTKSLTTSTNASGRSFDTSWAAS